MKSVKGKKTKCADGNAKAKETALICGKVLCEPMPEEGGITLLFRFALPVCTGEGDAAKKINAFYRDFGEALRNFCAKELLPRARALQDICREQHRTFRRFVCDVSCRNTECGALARCEIRLRVFSGGKTVLRRCFIQVWDLNKGRLVPEKNFLRFLHTKE